FEAHVNASVQHQPDRRHRREDLRIRHVGAQTTDPGADDRGARKDVRFEPVAGRGEHVDVVVPLPHASWMRMNVSSWRLWCRGSTGPPREASELRTAAYSAAAWHLIQEM